MVFWCYGGCSGVLVGVLVFWCSDVLVFWCSGVMVFWYSDFLVMVWFVCFKKTLR